MTQQIIITTPTNSGEGTPLATAFDYCNNNFSQLYSRAQVSPPPTLIGSIGDQAGMYAYDSVYFYYCFSNYNGNTAVWGQLEQAGNISATQLVNGSSSVAIPYANANIIVNVASTANVAVFSTLGASIKGIVSATGNVRGGNINTAGIVSSGGNVIGNYILGNVAFATGIPETYTNSNVISLLSSYGSNTISTTGNITAGYLLGNGSQLTGLPQSYTNSNVTSLLSAFGSNTISTAGNITAGNLLTTGIVGAQGNISIQGQVSATGNIVTSGYIIGDIIGNVTAILSNIPGPAGAIVYNDGSGNAAATAGLVFNPSGPNLLTVLGSISAQSNVIGGNLLTSGVVSATGNISGNYILGNGSQLTGLPQSYTNSNVSTFLAAFGSNTISTTGTITAGNITGGNLLTTGIVSATSRLVTSGTVSATSNVTGGNILTAGIVSSTSNITGGNILTAGIVSASGNILTAGIVSASGNIYTSSTLHVDIDVNVGGNISTTNLTGTGVSVIGNITGSYVFGNGSQLTGITTATATNISNGTSNVSVVSANSNITVAVNGTSNVIVFASTGEYVTGVVSATGNVTGGNILTSGLISATSKITGSSLIGTIVSATGNVTGGNILTAGFVTATGDVTGDNLLTSGSVSAVSSVTGDFIIGNGSQLTSLTGANVTGTVANATYALNASVVTSNAQPNITSIGILSSLSVSGNILSSNIVSNGIISTTGNVIAGNLSVGVGTVGLNNIVNNGSNSTGNIGSSSNYFDTVFATATTALYADLAECYLADANYAPGTVLSFGGGNEVTISATDADVLIVGVVSTNPAYKMNSGLVGEYVVPGIRSMRYGITTRTSAIARKRKMISVWLGASTT